MEELREELRQCKLQQSGGLTPQPTVPQHSANRYLANAGIMEQEVPGCSTHRF